VLPRPIEEKKKKRPETSIGSQVRMKKSESQIDMILNLKLKKKFGQISEINDIIDNYPN